MVLYVALFKVNKMYKNGFFILIVLLVFICSCTNKKDREITLKHIKQIRIQSEYVSSFIVDNNRAFVSDFFGEDYLVSCIDLNTKKTKQFFSRNILPFDFRQVDNLEIHNNKLYGFDSSDGFVGVYDLNIRRKEDIDTFRIPAKNTYFINKVFNRYFIAGIFPKKKYIILDSESKKMISESGEYLKKPNNNYDDLVHAAANFGASAFCEKDSLLANIVYIGGIIDFYKFDGKNLYKIKQYKIRDFNYKVIDQSYINEGVMGFISLAISEKYVYALYSGEKDKPNSSITTGEHLYVFNHKGELQRKFKLDIPSTNIAIDKKSNCLYSISQNDGVFINKYGNI